MKKKFLTVVVMLIMTTSYSNNIHELLSFSLKTSSTNKKITSFCEQALEYLNYLEIFSESADPLILGWDEADQLYFFNYLVSNGVAQTSNYYNLPDTQLVHSIAVAWNDFSDVRSKLIQLMYGNVDSITQQQYAFLIDSVGKCYQNSIARIDPGECEEILSACINDVSNFYIERVSACLQQGAAIYVFFGSIWGGGVALGCQLAAYVRFTKNLKQCDKNYKNCLDT